MKYIVMECHKGYAVLMDESARFVHAANLSYTVGQTVTSPFLMEKSEPQSEGRHISFRMTRIAAAAACLALAVSAGSFYYTRNFKTYSTVLISAKANIRMELNKKGEVLDLQGGNAEADELLKNYSSKGKDKVTVVNEIIDIEKSQNIISDDEVVGLYIKIDEIDEYKSYKKDFENGVTENKISVHEFGTPKPKDPEPLKPSKPDKSTAPTPEAPDPPHDGADTHKPPKPDVAGGPNANNAGGAPAAPAAPAAPPSGEPHAPAVQKPASGNKSNSKPAEKAVEPPKPADPASPAAPQPHEQSGNNAGPSPAPAASQSFATVRKWYPAPRKYSAEKTYESARETQQEPVIFTACEVKPDAINEISAAIDSFIESQKPEEPAVNSETVEAPKAAEAIHPQVPEPDIPEQHVQFGGYRHTEKEEPAPKPIK